MKRFFAAICCILLLILTGCGEKPRTPEFVAPTPAVEKPASTPVPEPAPTQRPYSEYNEMIDQLSIGYTESTAMRVDGFDKGSLEEVERASGVIILGTVLQKEDLKGGVGSQRGKIKVEKVYKGDGIAAGDILTLKEFIRIGTYEDGTLWMDNTGGYYLPAREYETYLFFLQADVDKTYYTVSEWYGKYPVNPAIAEAFENETLTHGLMQILYRDKVIGGIDRNQLPRPLTDIYKQVYEKYFSDEAVIASLEEQRRYEEHYGRPEPIPTFEPIPAEDVFWFYSGNKVIYEPAQIVTDAENLKEAHAKMNEQGFDVSELQTLKIGDREQERFYLQAVAQYTYYDMTYNTNEKEQGHYAVMTSFYTLEGEKIRPDEDYAYHLRLSKELRKELGKAVVSVTTVNTEAPDKYYHGFYIADFTDLEE